MSDRTAGLRAGTPDEAAVLWKRSVLRESRGYSGSSDYLGSEGFPCLVESMLCAVERRQRFVVRAEFGGSLECRAFSWTHSNGMVRR